MRSLLALSLLLAGAAPTQPFALPGAPLPLLGGGCCAAPAAGTHVQPPGEAAPVLRGRTAVRAQARPVGQEQAGRPGEDAEQYLRLARRHTKLATGGEAEHGELQALLGCQFRDLAVLRQAVTHRSAAPKSLDSNQRLEYLGDAVLGMVVAEHLFHAFPHFDEGQLSTMRKEVVSASALAKVARREDLGRFARLNAGEEATGGRKKEALLADLVEALIAAVFVDQGLDASRDLIMRWLGDDMKHAARDPYGSDYKSKLQELLRQVNVPVASYHVVENGPKHNQKFTAHVLVADQRLGWGVGRTKKAAERAAAEYSLQLLEEKGGEQLEAWCRSVR